MLRNLWNDECGAIVSIEMVLIITIAVLSLIVGWSEVAASVNQELDDISNAIGKFDQSYFFAGFAAPKSAGAGGGFKSWYNASAFADSNDECDSCSGASTIVCAAGTGPQANGG